jgi:hypothetical protein
LQQSHPENTTKANNINPKLQNVFGGFRRGAKILYFLGSQEIIENVK